MEVEAKTKDINLKAHICIVKVLVDVKELLARVKIEFLQELIFLSLYKLVIISLSKISKISINTLIELKKNVLTS